MLIGCLCDQAIFPVEEFEFIRRVKRSAADYGIGAQVNLQIAPVLIGISLCLFNHAHRYKIGVHFVHGAWTEDLRPLKLIPGQLEPLFVCFFLLVALFFVERLINFKCSPRSPILGMVVGRTVLHREDLVDAGLGHGECRRLLRGFLIDILIAHIICK